MMIASGVHWATWLCTIASSFALILASFASNVELRFLSHICMHPSPCSAPHADGRTVLGCVDALPGPQGTATLSASMKNMRNQMNEDSDLAVLMSSLRGSNLNDDDFAATGQQVNLMTVTSDGKDADLQLPLTYDPAAISDYWGVRPVSVISRVLQLGFISSDFLSRLLWDVAFGQVKKNEVKRAIQIRNIVTSLGPAYIKLGQALSIRPDLLSPAAMNELQKLCDKVPSFDTSVAMAVVDIELGKPWQESFAELSPEPIAAASLGQVYRGKLHTGVLPWILRLHTATCSFVRCVGHRIGTVSRCVTFFPHLLIPRGAQRSTSYVVISWHGDDRGDDAVVSTCFKDSSSAGEDVAVKVQRPGVLETVTIDLFIIRRFGLFLRQFPQIKTDVVDLLDEWAARFFEELDYVKEGDNATLFAEHMKDDLPQVHLYPAARSRDSVAPWHAARCTLHCALTISARLQVKVARTYEAFTARRVLTCEWLEGEKLSQSTADDVGTLVNLGVICYLKQLLQTGFFHAGACLACVPSTPCCPSLDVREHAAHAHIFWDCCDHYMDRLVSFQTARWPSGTF
jgi:predicted unusual protein kinase regulating ubiquinone biosynthesis (AarF/ABC1/UbiB family)